MESTTSAGIAADHRGMCRFEKKSDQGFRIVVSELKRWAVEAPKVIGERWVRSRAALGVERRGEAEELLMGEYGFSSRSEREEKLLIEGPKPCLEDLFGQGRDRIETIASYMA